LTDTLEVELAPLAATRVSGKVGRVRQVLLYMCPHTTIHMSTERGGVGSGRHSTICVLILQDMCPHTTICVLTLLYMCPHTTVYVSSYYYICVVTLLHIFVLNTTKYALVRQERQQQIGGVVGVMHGESLGSGRGGNGASARTTRRPLRPLKLSSCPLKPTSRPLKSSWHPLKSSMCAGHSGKRRVRGAGRCGRKKGGAEAGRRSGRTSSPSRRTLK
jgi:hypothetical protein